MKMARDAGYRTWRAKSTGSTFATNLSVRPQGLVEELRAEVTSTNADGEDRGQFFARRADPFA